MVAEGHVVEDFYIGDSHIKICDDYCRDKTPEDVEAILQRIGELVIHSLKPEAYKRAE